MTRTLSSAHREAADRLHSASIHVLRRVAREDAASGLSAARLSALSVLVFGGPRTLGELAAAERVRPPTITSIVRGLEDAGLAELVVDAVRPRVVGAPLAQLEPARELLVDRRREPLDLVRVELAREGEGR